MLGVPAKGQWGQQLPVVAGMVTSPSCQVAQLFSLDTGFDFLATEACMLCFALRALDFVACGPTGAGFGVPTAMCGAARCHPSSFCITSHQTNLPLPSNNFPGVS